MWSVTADDWNDHFLFTNHVRVHEHLKQMDSSSLKDPTEDPTSMHDKPHHCLSERLQYEICQMFQTINKKCKPPKTKTQWRKHPNETNKTTKNTNTHEIFLCFQIIFVLFHSNVKLLCFKIELMLHVHFCYLFPKYNSFSLSNKITNISPWAIYQTGYDFMVSINGVGSS